MKAGLVSGLTLLAAMILLVATTIPYVSTWLSFNSLSRETNIVQVQGETHIIDEDASPSIVNTTAIAVYPKAAVEVYSNIFVMYLAFLVDLDPSITWFQCRELGADFCNLARTYSYSGRQSLSYSQRTLVNFERRSEIGSIPSFSENVSLSIDPGLWPPASHDVSPLLYLTDQIEAFPHVIFQGQASIETNNPLTFVTMSVFFNMSRYPTTIYRFNYPSAVWLAYGGSLFTMVIASAKLLHDHQKKASVKKAAALSLDVTRSSKREYVSVT